ncbi:MAG: hypothetical protein HY673_27140 [Chloroflexi bacterium]|nr:hypothetical protein [Chloroflexota bacterium]
MEDATLGLDTGLEIIVMKIRNLKAGDLERLLHRFEVTYKLSSAEFNEKFNRGELDENPDFVRWATYYDMASKAGPVDLELKV